MTGICDLNRKTYLLKKIFKSNVFHEVHMGINKDYTLSLSSMSKMIFSSVPSLSRVQLFATPWTAARQDSLSITSSQSLLAQTCVLNQWCHQTISSSVIPFSCLQAFPASGSFLMSQFLLDPFLCKNVSLGIPTGCECFRRRHYRHPMLWGWMKLVFLGTIIIAL